MPRLTMTASETDRIRSELLKLLLQVAWADHEVGEEERAAVRRFARAIPQLPQAEIESYLDGSAPLPAPNVELLKRHKEEALFLVKSLARADLEISDEEHALVQLIRDTLYERG